MWKLVSRCFISSLKINCYEKNINSLVHIKRGNKIISRKKKIEETKSLSRWSQNTIKHSRISLNVGCCQWIVSFQPATAQNTTNTKVGESNTSRSLAALGTAVRSAHCIREWVRSVWRVLTDLENKNSD